MKAPLLSIIIPTHNEEKLLPRLLNDLAEQKMRDFEVIMVDARSTDQTTRLNRTLVKKLPRLLLLSSRIKQVNVQRNKGAKRAKGTYIFFLDADLQLPRRFLGQLKEKLMLTQPAFATMYLVPDSKKIWAKLFTQSKNMLLELTRTIGRPLMGGSPLIIKRSVFIQSGGFKTDGTFGEDFDLGLRLFAAGYRLKFYNVPKVIDSLRVERRQRWLKVVGLHIFDTFRILVKYTYIKVLTYTPGSKVSRA
jgi:glycosyltransferase involved in cell wall biosynthesis